MSMSDELKSSAIQKIASDIATEAGIAEEDVQKVLNVLGIDGHQFDDAAKLLGVPPTLRNIRLGFKISKSTVAV
jgi:hypothetical protein